MKRTVPLLVILALTAAGGYAEDAAPPVPQMAEGFKPPAEKIERPYTNDKCLEKCHGEPGFGAGSVEGVLRVLHVNAGRYVFSIHGQKGVECIDCHQEADPNFHPRTGYRNVDCRACHAENPPEDAYPPNGLARLAEKGIQRPPPESRKAETWVTTKHAKAWFAGDRKAPFCYHCHTAHYVYRVADPRATMHPSNRPETCGICHVDQVRAYDVGGLLARFRIGAHGKGDLSNRYDVTECVACHQGQAAHGEETVTGQACPTCHRVPEEGEEGVEWASLHIKPLAESQPGARALRYVYGVGFWAVVALGALFALFLGFSTLYRREG